ncbi:MAG: GTP-binding protein [Candidatus Hermodarchaeota archaeon]
MVSGAVQSGKSTYIKYLDKKAMNVQVKGQNNKLYTVAMDLGSLKVNGFDVFLFGTPGLIRFRVMTELICRGADGLIFIFDAAHPEKDNNAISLLNSIRKVCEPNIPITYLANKQDLEGARKPEMIRKKNRLPEDANFFPTSIKKGLNIDKSLRFLVNEIYDNYKELLQILLDYENDIRGLADKLHKNKEQIRDFLNMMELKRFIAIDRTNRIYKVREGLKHIIM